MRSRVRLAPLFPRRRQLFRRAVRPLRFQLCQRARRRMCRSPLRFQPNRPLPRRHQPFAQML
jgi:hypothetical protein